ncbi:helix-turn-helix domain-containing protein [Weissella confusa]|uniref:helix-turn-helix domain-containing protein n=1 Tax=Weissella confusa TaxID=1583 RepID=UPI0018F23D99|nr:helix-turn-helix domain-containing protein [Weissella confusa]MBJ7687349.1 hypothetical protein [Weissella confusa]MBJ7697192.1 hypothetical protein [Weissella confusa]
MEWLLPKKDQERLSLHRYLNAQESNAVLIKDIMADLGWSRYMVLQNVETLRIDCQQIGDGNISYLTLVDSNRALQIEQLQTISDTALMGYYIRNSLRFDVLMDIFFEVAQSNETIAFRHSSSTTVARVTKVEVNDELAKYGIHISNNYQLVGDERNIRILLFEMLYTAYADQPSPFPDDIKALAAKVEHLVEEHTPMRATVKRAFRIFFGIWMTRIRHGHVIAPSEPRFGLGSLYSLGLGFGTYRIDNLAPEAAQTFDNIYQDVATVYEDFFGLSMTEAELAMIRKSLFSLDLRLLYFRMTGISTQPRKQFSERVYPIHTEFTRRVLEKIAPYFDMPHDKIINALYNEYLNTFVLALDVSEILPVVTVTVDLIDMTSLERVLRERIMDWHAVNLNFTKYFTNDTDLCVSNVKLDDQVPGFVWRAIPDQVAVQALLDKLIDITTTRFYQLTGNSATQSE